MSATAWIATGQDGRVMHFSKADGWTVDAVIAAPSAAPSDDALATKAARERRYDLRTPLIRAIYDVALAIEDCGASEKLTRAVTLCGELYEPVRVLLEERDTLTAELAQARERIAEMERERQARNRP